jgi:hypothetical protein
MAASEGRVDCLKILLNLNVDPSVTDNRGRTCFSFHFHLQML